MYTFIGIIGASLIVILLVNFIVTVIEALKDF
jgi:hypothetical protein